MFTKSESNALIGFLERVDAYDYLDQFDGLEPALDKLYDLLDTDLEKPW